jgi:guanylate cyclase
MLVQLCYGLLYLAYQETAAGLVAIGGATLFFLSIFTVGIWKNYTAHGYFWMVISYIVVFGATILLGGIGNSGFFVIWLMLAPLMALVAHKQSTWQYWFIVAIGGMIGIGFLQPWLRSSNNLPSNVIFIVVLINTISYFSLMFFVLSYYIKQNQKLSQLVKEERNKADRLLLNILPLEIATLLKNGNQVIAERYDEVSILFADVVNFTQMSEKITPETLVALLNEVFSHIDLLVEKYGLEKIKTIGDCYMAASGVPVPRTDHAIMLTRLAMDIQSFINGRQFQGQQLTIRIGINSGAVVAGVIGRKKFIYDLWGDAVNTASRMESHGSAGCIQITASTMQLIQHQYICEPKGLMTIKGKGNIPVWHVLAKKAAEV